MMLILKPFLAVVATSFVASAQSTCSSSLAPSYSASVASGYQVGLVATGLARPRGIQFDKAGHLLVVEAPRGGESGISALTLRDSGGVCVRQASKKTVVSGQGVGASSLDMRSRAHVHARSIMESLYLTTEAFFMHLPWTLSGLGNMIQPDSWLQTSVVLLER